MPGPVVHIGFSLGFGTLIMASSKGSFTPAHCLILAFNSFLGPDLGSFAEWSLKKTFPNVAGLAMSWIHHSVGYALICGPLMAVLSSSLLRKIVLRKRANALTMNLESKTTESEPLSFLSVKQCYLLAIAGCLLHFQVDHVFEEDGRDPLYRWILSTGYFSKPTPPLSPIAVMFVGFCTCVLFFGFAWIHLFSSSLSEQSLVLRLRYTFYLFSALFTIYICFLAVSQIILDQIAVVGEEADLGVLIFIIVFHFSPFILCLLSMPSF